MSSEPLIYNTQHQVLICRSCQTVVGPRWQAIERHLRGEPHRALGPALKAYRAYTDSLTLQTLDGLRQGKPQLPCAPLEFLATFAGYSCLLCEQQSGSSSASTTGPARFFTTYLPRLQRNHLPSHGQTAQEHRLTPLWRPCQLQTYFTAGGRIDYFEVTGPAATSQSQGSGEGSGSGSDSLPAAPTTATTAATTATAIAAQQALFTNIEQDAGTIQQDVDRQAVIVQDLNASRTEQVPWLDKTGFPAYLAGLQDSQIKSAYKLPPKDPAKAATSDRDLARILAATQARLDQAYQLCNSTSPDCKMNQ